jgi:Domain of unknown function (DUF4386)
MHPLDPNPTNTPNSTRLSRTAAALLVVDGLLSLTPVVILGGAFGWPDSLRFPAATQLQAIAAKPDALAWGYGLYLLYSIWVAPAMIVLTARLFGGLQSALASTVAVLAGLSALARCIGILRWLTVMPALALAHASAEPAQQQLIQTVFTALNQWGGGIGELLGVSLFMALALGLLSVGAWVQRRMPLWLCALGGVCALLLAGLSLPALRIPVEVPVAIAVSLLGVWMWAVAAWLLWSRQGQR